MTKKRSSPTAKSPSAISIPRGFAEVFQELKKKIQEARLSAAVAVNQQLIKLYWEMGKTIFEIQQTQKWGSRDIESLGNELQKEFPGISGFSRSNLFKMRAFYLSYEKVSQTVKQFEELPISQIPWGHNVILVTKIKDTKERLWYAHMTIEEGWSREAMKIMKKTLQIFPDYLFGRVEYALYLLRRGEPEKAHAVLENAGTLSQLYPERKVFHAAEWKAFAYVMSRYWIQKNDLNQAKIYLEMIQKISPKSHEIKDLQKKMKSKVFAQFMEKQQIALTNQMSTG